MKTIHSKYHKAEQPDTVNDRFRNSEKDERGQTFKSKYQSGTGKVKGFFKLF